MANKLILSVLNLRCCRQVLFCGVRTFSNEQSQLSVKQEVEFDQVTLLPTLQVQQSNDTDKIDWNAEVESLKIHAIDPLLKADPTRQVPSYFPKSFNLAAYVNTAPSLQKLVNLGVNLAHIEYKPNVVEAIIKLDFDSDIAPCIQFLTDHGVPAYSLGQFITKNPMILKEDLNDLETRINYLQIKEFTSYMITRIITANPFWLMFRTHRIDSRLGMFQRTFDLSGDEVRHLATRCPQLVTYNVFSIKLATFSVTEEFGFSSDEMKQLLLTKPRLWIIQNKSLKGRFDYVHNTMKIPHDMIVRFPEVLTSRESRVKQRHLFLKSLNRDIFDPKQNGYISLETLVKGTDEQFCSQVAKSSVHIFNNFLKTL